MQIAFDKNLNEQQLAAVTAPAGPALVIAGAGSGKTRTLTYRAAYLISQGIPPDRILLLTFTNKAAKEMLQRTGALTNLSLSELWGGTFHSIGNRFLRKHSGLVGYPNNFTIIDREDSKALIEKCISEVFGSDKVKIKKFPKPEVLIEIFSLASGKVISIKQLLDETYDWLREFTEEIESVQNVYSIKKRESSLVDFEDLLVLWKKALVENPDLLQYYQSKFNAILVDEYQDTNKLQAELVDLLARVHQNLMVVGDDAQSIYSWRGASVTNIIEFPRRYPNARIYKIETNYRSTQEILRIANATVHKASYYPKILSAVREEKNKPYIIACKNAQIQAVVVAKQILTLIDQGVDPSKIAVLYRAHFHTLELQMELISQKIPFQITSGIRFFEQAHIKDVVAYLKLAVNPRDETAFRRLLLALPGIGNKTVNKLWKDYLVEISKNPTPNAANALRAITTNVPGKTVLSWPDFITRIESVDVQKHSLSPASAIENILQLGYKEYLLLTYNNPYSRIDDLKHLQSYAESFADIFSFLDQMSLLSNIESETNDIEDKPGHVKLSTIHQAKGLEFDAVFIIMLNEGLFPSVRAIESGCVDEEYRLFYVAITRARDYLFMLYPMSRYIGSDGNFSRLEPSRLLFEIPKELCNTMYISNVD